jgi:diguanylate cyclase (GGDEF)-like protein
VATRRFREIMVQDDDKERQDSSADPVAPEAAALDAELARLETAIYTLDAGTIAAIARVVSLAQASSAAALSGRALCLQARILAATGNHLAGLPHADQAIDAFNALDAGAAQIHAGFIAEAWRVAGVTRMGLARNAEALRLIEQAIRIAEKGITSVPEPHLAGTPICASTALIRARSTLGGILLTARNLEGALDALDGAVTAIDAAPDKAALIANDVLVVFGNITETLHRLVREDRAAGEDETAARHLEAARIILETRLRPLVLPAATSGQHTDAESRSLGIYWEQMGESFLLRDQPLDALNNFSKSHDVLAAISRTSLELGMAYTGLARACLALGHNDQALAHAQAAVEAISEEDVYYHSVALSVLSNAFRAVGDFRQALNCFESFNKLRNKLEAASAQQYAAQVTARIGLARAQAEAEAERKTTATLEVLGQLGQQITANLQAEKIFETLYRHVGNLLDAASFVIWLLDAADGTLHLAFGREDEKPLAAPDLHLDDPLSRAALAVRERREILAEIRDDQPNSSTIPGSRQMKTVLFAPLILGNRCLGVLSVQSDRVQAYDDTARWILRTLCAYGAIALDNAAAHRQLSETLNQLHVSQAQLARRTEELERLSTIDPLTGAGNRRYLESEGLVEIAAARRNGHPLGVVLFDLDHFKTINDLYGHAVGDDVLKTVVDATRHMLRPKDFLARLGGEEFALLLPASKRPESRTIAERVRTAIAATPFGIKAARFAVTASFGISELKPGEQNLSAALSRADKALYRAKQEGRNRVITAEGGL